MLDLVSERDSAVRLVNRIQQRVLDLFGPNAAELDSLTADLHRQIKARQNLLPSMLKLSFNPQVALSTKCLRQSNSHDKAIETQRRKIDIH